jgi:gamma-glutamyltranspeptidase/glutathione hydrolase
VLRNPDYAHFLGQVADETVTGFSSEPLATSLVTAMTEHSGLVTRQDLLAYRPVARSPLVAEYAGARVATNALPSFGGAILVDALEVLGQRAPGRQGRQDQGGPSDTGGRAVAVLESLAEATDRQKQRAFSAAQSSQGTTHVSVVDGDGLTVSMTTSNGSCSGVFAPGTGIQLNNVMGERDLHPWGFHALRPGTRIGSMMAPTIVDLPDGSIVALGSGGSERIRSALLQTVVHLVDGHTLSDAVAAPRMHWDGDVLQVEPGLAPEVAAAVASVGPVNRWTARDLYFGGVQAVLRQPDGQVAAVGDPRRGGAGVVVTP